MSDSESSKDSDCGIRFKTQSVRNIPARSTETRSSSHSSKIYSSEYYDSIRRASKRDSRSRENDRHSSEKRKKKHKKHNRDDDLPRSKTKIYSDDSSRRKSNSSLSYDRYERVQLPNSHKVIDYVKESKTSDYDTLEDEEKKVSEVLDSKGKLIYGPVLPGKVNDEYAKSIAVTSEKQKCYGPILPNKIIEENLVSSDDEKSDIYGPELPNKNREETSTLKFSDKSDETVVYGPILPSKPDTEKAYGPLLPNIKNGVSEESPEEQRVYGPMLPKIESFDAIESAIESNENLSCNSPKVDTKPVKIYGPSLPSTEDNKDNSQPSTSCNNLESENTQNSSEDEEIIGPLPIDSSNASSSQALTELEIRALELKLKTNVNDNEKQIREDWMLTLPEVKLFQGLGPRQFRANIGPDFSDRTSWTDTPEDKAKKKSGKSKSTKVDLVAEAEYLAMKARDKEQEKMVKKHKKHSKRDKSLLDIHQEKMSKKKEETGKTERRPFDRDIDLKLNRLDPTKKAAMIKHASLLDSKFSVGKTKFL